VSSERKGGGSCSCFPRPSHSSCTRVFVSIPPTDPRRVGQVDLGLGHSRRPESVDVGADEAEGARAGHGLDGGDAALLHQRVVGACRAQMSATQSSAHIQLRWSSVTKARVQLRAQRALARAVPKQLVADRKRARRRAWRTQARRQWDCKRTRQSRDAPIETKSSSNQLPLRCHLRAAELSSEHQLIIDCVVSVN